METTSTEEIKKPSFKESVWDVIKFAFFALVIVIPIRAFIAQPFIVSGESMVPTFENNEYLIIDEISYRFKEPMRGDVIVFRYPLEPKKFFIKRIIGLPGDVVSIKGASVTITNTLNPEGFMLEEPYVTNTSSDEMTKAVKEGEYFVMGDNRIASLDSRSWGLLPKENIIGRTFLRLLPLGHIGVFPGHTTYIK